MFYIGYDREKNGKIILSETKRPSALLFGMQHHLVDLYQVCSKYTPWAHNGRPQGSDVLHRLI